MSQSDPVRHRLQVCRFNRFARAEDALAKLRATGTVVEVEECLDQCTRCEGCAFALVSGAFEFAPTVEELLRRIRRRRRGIDTRKDGGMLASQ